MTEFKPQYLSHLFNQVAESKLNDSDINKLKDLYQSWDKDYGDQNGKISQDEWNQLSQSKDFLAYQKDFSRKYGPLSSLRYQTKVNALFNHDLTNDSVKDFYKKYNWYFGSFVSILQRNADGFNPEMFYVEGEDYQAFYDRFDAVAIRENSYKDIWEVIKEDYPVLRDQTLRVLYVQVSQSPLHSSSEELTRHFNQLMDLTLDENPGLLVEKCMGSDEGKEYLVDLINRYQKEWSENPNDTTKERICDLARAFRNKMDRKIVDDEKLDQISDQISSYNYLNLLIDDEDIDGIIKGLKEAISNHTENLNKLNDQRVVVNIALMDNEDLIDEDYLQSFNHQKPLGSKQRFESALYEATSMALDKTQWNHPRIDKEDVIDARDEFFEGLSNLLKAYKTSRWRDASEYAELMDDEVDSWIEDVLDDAKDLPEEIKAPLIKLQRVSNEIKVAKAMDIDLPTYRRMPHHPLDNTDQAYQVIDSIDQAIGVILVGYDESGWLNQLTSFAASAVNIGDKVDIQNGCKELLKIAKKIELASNDEDYFKAIKDLKELLKPDGKLIKALEAIKTGWASLALDIFQGISEIIIATVIPVAGVALAKKSARVRELIITAQAATVAEETTIIAQTAHRAVRAGLAQGGAEVVHEGAQSQASEAKELDIGDVAQGAGIGMITGALGGAFLPGDKLVLRTGGRNVATVPGITPWVLDAGRRLAVQTGVDLGMGVADQTIRSLAKGESLDGAMPDDRELGDQTFMSLVSLGAEAGMLKQVATSGGDAIRNSISLLGRRARRARDRGDINSQVKLLRNQALLLLDELNLSKVDEIINKLNNIHKETGNITAKLTGLELSVKRKLSSGTFPEIISQVRAYLELAIENNIPADKIYQVLKPFFRTIEIDLEWTTNETPKTRAILEICGMIFKKYPETKPGERVLDTIVRIIKHTKTHDKGKIFRTSEAFRNYIFGLAIGYIGYFKGDQLNILMDAVLDILDDSFNETTLKTEKIDYYAKGQIFALAHLAYDQAFVIGGSSGAANRLRAFALDISNRLPDLIKYIPENFTHRAKLLNSMITNLIDKKKYQEAIRYADQLLARELAKDILNLQQIRYTIYFKALAIFRKTKDISKARDVVSKYCEALAQKGVDDDTMSEIKNSLEEQIDQLK